VNKKYSEVGELQQTKKNLKKEIDEVTMKLGQE